MWVVGNIVVFSVYCGVVDLSFGDVLVVLMVGYLVLLLVMGLIYGVYGIGDIVVISVYVVEFVVFDIDVYMWLLDVVL